MYVYLCTSIATMKNFGESHMFPWTEWSYENLEKTTLLCTGQNYHAKTWRKVHCVANDRASMQGPKRKCCTLFWICLTEVHVPCLPKKTNCILLWTELPWRKLFYFANNKSTVWSEESHVATEKNTIFSHGGRYSSYLWIEIIINFRYTLCLQ